MPERRNKPRRVLFRDKSGRFLPAEDRYSEAVGSIQIWRHGRYVTVAERPVPPKQLVSLMSRGEFESLPEAVIPFADYKSSKKYKAWDIAEQIDHTKGIRRKELKFTIRLQDGHRQRKVTFYHTIRRNKPSSVEIWSRINQEIGMEGLYLYDKVGGRILADRTGKKVSLLGVDVEEVI